MSPAVKDGTEVQVRVPRASGDEPAEAQTIVYQIMCSPRERG